MIAPNSENFRIMFNMTMDELIESDRFTPDEKVEFIDYLRDKILEQQVQMYDEETDLYNI